MRGFFYATLESYGSVDVAEQRSATGMEENKDQLKIFKFFQRRKGKYHLRKIPLKKWTDSSKHGMDCGT